MLESIVAGGALTSITAGALVGRFGRDVRRFALQLASEGLIHNVASDSHDTLNRPPGVIHELKQAGLEPIAEWLTESVPSAILDGDEIPRRPSTRLTVARPEGRLGWLKHKLPTKRA
jgi:protein-tyrosine phosphatase